jgi:hypothetical protein
MTFLSLINDVNDVNVPSKSNKKKNNFLLISWRSLTKIAGSGSASGSISERYGSADPDPYQNFMDPQHWLSTVLVWSTVVGLSYYLSVLLIQTILGSEIAVSKTPAGDSSKGSSTCQQYMHDSTTAREAVPVNNTCMGRTTAREAVSEQRPNSLT